MRIAEINMLHKGSTGKIMFGIADSVRSAESEVKTYSPCVFYLRSRMDAPKKEGHTYFGYRWENMLHIVSNRLFCANGCFSVFGTWQLIQKLKEYRPDIIHLHNLHNQTISLPLLFHYIRKSHIKVVWTLHDCWSMTGRCPHFVMAKCDRWKTGCGHCPQIKEYPRAYIDLTHMMWKLKKKWFTSVEDMVIVTPSQWLADIAQESYLQKYPVKVINNGIDLDVFKPTQSGFRKKHHCENKKIVLGVAFGWGARKGLDVFVDLASRLPADYQIVLVGTDGKLDKQLPENIISIHRTQNQQELAEIYSAADVFANPTRQDTFPTVNIESLACGTPVVTFETGGSPEIINDLCGIVVSYDDVDTMEKAICYVCEEKPFSQEACVKRANCFDMQDRYQEYMKLYEQLSE